MHEVGGWGTLAISYWSFRRPSTSLGVRLLPFWVIVSFGRWHIMPLERRALYWGTKARRRSCSPLVRSCDTYTFTSWCLALVLLRISLALPWLVRVARTRRDCSVWRLGVMRSAKKHWVCISHGNPADSFLTVYLTILIQKMYPIQYNAHLYILLHAHSYILSHQETRYDRVDTAQKLRTRATARESAHFATT